MLALAFYGPAGAGKTKLIERLVGELRKKYSVATVKHIPKEMDWDRAGKDTYRHKAAGAGLVVGAAENATVFFYGKLALSEILAKLQGFDVVLVEGYRSEKELPKVSLSVPPEQRAPNTVLAYEGELQPILRYIEANVEPRFSLRVDDKPVPVNAFVREFIKNTVLGMLRSLKKCTPAKSVALEFALE